jgi:hypothetical protein
MMVVLRQFDPLAAKDFCFMAILSFIFVSNSHNLKKIPQPKNGCEFSLPTSPVWHILMPGHRPDFTQQRFQVPKHE